MLSSLVVMVLSKVVVIANGFYVQNIGEESENADSPDRREKGILIPDCSKVM